LNTRQGGDAEARLLLDELARSEFDVLPDNDKLFGWSVLAEVCSALEADAHASRLYELLLPYAGRNAVSHPACAIGSVSRYLGLLAALLGRFDEAASHFEQALSMNERMGARPWLAHTQEDYAQMLLARAAPGDGDRARALLEQALSAYRDLGMEPHAARASALLERAPA
jgi:tetratricopeptide (TPR) repeat protein